MSDKSQRLYDCLTEIDDELVEEAADWLEAVDGSGGGGPRPEPAAAPPTAPARRTAGKPAWRRWGALAAVLVFAVGAGGYALTHSGIGGLGGNYSVVHGRGDGFCNLFVIGYRRPAADRTDHFRVARLVCYKQLAGSGEAAGGKTGNVAFVRWCVRYRVFAGDLYT